MSDGERTQRTITREEPSLAVVNTVADMMNKDPTSLELLYDNVDPDKLDGLFQTDRQDEAGKVEVTFRYEGCDVEISDAVNATREHAREHSLGN